MKQNQCKIWSDCVGYLPALVPIDDNKGQGVNIDFTNCKEVQSTALTILLVRILKILKKSASHGWNSTNSDDINIFEIVKKLGFFEILSYEYNQYTDLFNPQVEVGNFAGAEFPINQQAQGYIVKSFPIYPLNLTKSHPRRATVELFKKWLLNVLQPIGDKFLFNSNQLIQVLYEMGKNSADHTDADAFFGMDLIVFKNFFELHFCFADLGEGIKQHVQRNLPPEKAKRNPHWSLYESYHHALKYGYTSNPSSRDNKGFGMTFILDACSGIGIELSVFDAKSRGLLTCILQDAPSHAILRKSFYNVGVNTGFYYYGVLKLQRDISE
jgi:hypothetical protein